MFINFRFPEGLMISTAKKYCSQSEKLNELTKKASSNWNCTLQMEYHMIYSYSRWWNNFEHTISMVRTSKDFVTKDDKVWQTQSDTLIHS